MDPPRSTTAAGTPADFAASDGVHSTHSSQVDARSEHQSISIPATIAATALSQEQPATPNASNKRKSSKAPGGRGVANLTPGQLAKKRANDRAAQRAIRERTRKLIDTLERRIHDLEGQQPFQELQRVIQERDWAISECEAYRRRLGTITELARERQQASGNEQQQRQTSDSPHVQQYQQQRSQPGSRSPTAAVHTKSPMRIDTTSSTHQSHDGAFRRWSAGQDYAPDQSISTPQPKERNQDHHVAPTAPQQGHRGHGERLELNFLLDHSCPQSTRSTPLPDSYRSSPVGDSLPIYARETLLAPPSCPLDSLLIDFHKSRRRLMHEGASPLEAIGPPDPFFATMIAPGLSHLGICHPLSSLMIEILSKFPDINRLPEKVAVYFIMFLVMQWSICPCEKCYDRLPDWCRPVPGQYERSHVAWVDYLPWPAMRSYICFNPVRFEDFFVPYTTTLSLNWPFPSEFVLISIPRSAPDDPPNLIMNPVFEHHLRDLRNWSLGSTFRDTFPHLVNHTIRIQDSP